MRRPVQKMATLLTPCRKQTVEIKDISQTGAKILLGRSISSKTGILSWEDQKIWCEIVWIDGLNAGIRFVDEQADAKAD